MKLLIDDTTARTHNLNANEACVYAAILKCTKAGRGWFANYRDLAYALPFVISRPTAYRAVQKLLNLGLIYENENKVLFAVQNEQSAVQNEQSAVQNEQSAVQNEQSAVQNEQSAVQNELPPNNPPINNNMKEKEEEQQRALYARDCDKQQGCLFDKFWNYFKPSAEYQNRRAATQMLFEARSEVAQRAIVEAAQEGGGCHPGDKQNPYFYVQDFPEPQPTFLRGDESGDIVQVRYNGAYKLCYRATMELFGLEYVRDWN
jgi:hypothetical protein